MWRFALLIGGLFLVSQRVNAQVAVDVIKLGIAPGQELPDLVLKHILHFKTKSAKISDFKGKSIILDFWASWCSPCLAMLPKVERLQIEYKDQVQFIPVTYESAEVITPILDRLKIGKSELLPFVFSETTLQKLFPHVYLPHYIWIDKAGVVRFITGMEEINEKNIEGFLKSQSHIENKEGN